MTAATASVPVRPARPPRSALRLGLLHAKYQFLEAIRIPIAVIGTMMFPTLAMVFFVVPNQAVAQNPVFATAAVAQLGMFSIMATCLFTYGTGVAEDRDRPFDPYMRTLPAGASAQMIGRVANGLIFAALGLLPLVLAGWILTAATLSWSRLLVSVLTILALAIPFTMLGLGIGYSLPSKAAIAVVQVVLFPLAFAGGLFLPPQMFPGWLDAFSQALPSRAGRDLLVQVTSGEPAYGLALPVLLGWTVLFAVFVVWAYRRDEGRRFR
ncbi:ABC-2 type transporter [Beutenbergia cavernae DSM 12333]|uniref:ABC-2 type transporter n=1 Tax=Beutenbergia cavernae (strain ATCC BAA-8 / DSM 12333 / CCUG 43141 / JCM 11478 / NBRC 16432 / NCIMB 13614 / HKI 0122) TaxID=471853 RepID=C5C5C5_BEUC1|nr:ABC transporter permease [Beutenbergia cavernae]ACQ82265.1 ABC-2 type transporter [Beutenbergia cavernae DSM 12333]